MSPPKIVNQEEKRLHIAQAAMEVFARMGYNKATIATVAKEAGIGKGTVYEYFRSKEDLFLGGFDAYAEGMQQALRSALVDSRDDPAQQLTVISNTIAAMLEESKELFPLMMDFWAMSAAGEPQVRKHLSEHFAAMYDVFRDMLIQPLRQGVREGVFRKGLQPKAVATAWVGVFDGLFLQAWFDPTVDVKGAAKAHLSVMLTGLRTGKADTP